jgi:hypothetical protein
MTVKFSNIALIGGGFKVFNPPTGDVNAQLAISPPNISLEEGSGTDTDYIYTVTKTGTNDVNVTVDWAVTGSGSNPANASDFVGGVFPSGTLTFTPSTATQIITVSVNGDLTIENDEEFTVTLSNPQPSGATITTATATGTILNDEVELTTTPSNITLAEGDSGPTDFIYTVTKNGFLDENVTVDWAVTGTGVNPAQPDDFVGGVYPSGTVTFTPLDTVETFTVQVQGDLIFESDKTFTVTMSDPEPSAKVSLVNTTVTGTIVNDDPEVLAIPNALRFATPSVATQSRLERTPSVAGNRRTWTWSAWIKKPTLNIVQRLFAARVGGTGTNFVEVRFETDNTLRCDFRFNNVTIANLTIDKRFDDGTNWYHLVIAVDTTQATAANRCRIYVNGTEFAVTGGSLELDGDYGVNNNIAHRIGVFPSSTTATKFLGSMAEINHVDGQQLPAVSFGNFIDGFWQPKFYFGTYGTNGYRLQFNTLTYGDDTSGNGNNWTTNGLDTTGNFIAQIQDTPTNNFAIATIGSNPDTAGGTSFEVTGGGSTIRLQNFTFSPKGFGIPKNSGKYYLEINVDSANNFILGITNDYFANTSATLIGSIGTAWWLTNGNVQVNNEASTAYGSAPELQNAIAIDSDTGNVWFRRNGTWQNSGDPDTGTNPAFTDLYTALNTDMLFIGADVTATVSRFLTFNFGQHAFNYTPPTAFTKRMKISDLTPNINPKEAFDSRIRVGTGATFTVNDYEFSPNLVWTKRNVTEGSPNSLHVVYDTERGATNRISFTSDSQTTENGLTAFVANGFTGGDVVNFNNSGDQYIDWTWKEDPAYGFDIVTYTGNGGTLNVSHNLGAVPEMIIVRRFGSTPAVTRLWHKDLSSATHFLNLSGAPAGTETTTGTFLGGDGITSTTVGVTNNGTTQMNINNGTYVMYLWRSVPGFSRIGSIVYTNNGTNIVYTGFTPGFILARPIADARNATIWNSTRVTSNATPGIFVNASDAWSTGMTAAINTAGWLYSNENWGASQPATNNRMIYAAFADKRMDQVRAW